MPPGGSEKIQRLKDECAEGELPYISKSRVKTWKNCPRKFFFTYVLGMRPDDNIYFTKGRRIHETFEIVYERAIDQVSEREAPHSAGFPNLYDLLPTGDQGRLWTRWTDHVANWIDFEINRMRASSSVEEWLPVGVEVELWDDDPPVRNSPPFMGFADLIVNTSTIPNVEGDGVTIIDFKTGNIPKEQYREGGILLEGTYYRMLFEKEYDRKVDAVAGFYPYGEIKDEPGTFGSSFIVSPKSKERRDRVLSIIKEMVDADHSNPEEYPLNENWLCCWDDEGGQCDFYANDTMEAQLADPMDGECSSMWGRPSHKGSPTFGQ